MLAHIADIPQLKTGLRRRPRHSRHDGVGDVRRAGEGHAGARCAAAPRRSTSASSTASRRSGSPTSSASRARRPATTSRPTSSASPASATTWTRPRQFAHDHGYVETIFGRRIHYPEINTKNPSMRGFLERAAINAPIQGSAADIIRRAMIRMPAALREARLDSAAHAAAGARRTGLRGASRPRSRRRSPVVAPGDGEARRCRRCSSPCRSTSTPRPPTTGKRRIEASAVAFPDGRRASRPSRDRGRAMGHIVCPSAVDATPGLSAQRFARGGSMRGEPSASRCQW